MALQEYVHVETLEEYSERFKDYAHLERTEDGILLCRLGWKGEACVWSYQTQRSLGELWTAIGHDKKNEVIILTCEDPYWITQRSDPASFDEVEDSTDVGLKYECNVPDTMNFVARFIHDIEVPVVAAINGIGQHYEFALMADVCICYPDFYFSDAHFSHNIVPGDGMNFSYRMCLGQSRASYMAYMEPKIDAKTALEWGLVDEVVPHDKLHRARLRDRQPHHEDRPRRAPSYPRAGHASVEALLPGRRARPRAGRDVRRAAGGHPPQLRQDRRRLHRRPPAAPEVVGTIDSETSVGAPWRTVSFARALSVSGSGATGLFIR